MHHIMFIARCCLTLLLTYPPARSTSPLSTQTLCVFPFTNSLACPLASAVCLSSTRAHVPLRRAISGVALCARIPWVMHHRPSWQMTHLCTCAWRQAPSTLQALRSSTCVCICVLCTCVRVFVRLCILDLWQTPVLFPALKTLPPPNQTHTDTHTDTDTDTGTQTHRDTHTEAHTETLAWHMFLMLAQASMRAFFRAVGDMTAVSAHTHDVAVHCRQRLAQLRHSASGRAAVVFNSPFTFDEQQCSGVSDGCGLMGLTGLIVELVVSLRSCLRWLFDYCVCWLIMHDGVVCWRMRACLQKQGPVVNFNLIREDGSAVSPSEVCTVLALNGVHARAGVCVCARHCNWRWCSLSLPFCS